MPSTYIASAEPIDTSTPMAKTPPIDDGARSESPKTPENVQRIPRDDSFKTCKPTPRRLRQTPARMSIMGGGKPYKEATSSGMKKFNSRRKYNTSQNNLANETCNSNETFVKCEQALQFEGDSLEGPGSVPKRRDAKPLAQQQLHQQQQPEPLLESECEIPSFTELKIVDSQQISPKKKTPQRQSPKKQTPKRQSPKKQTPKQRPDKKSNSNESKQMPPPRPRPIFTKTKLPLSREQLLKQNQQQQNKARLESQATRNQFLTPKLPTFRKPPASLISTASRYMNSFNTSRLTRSTSFKSTAELERAYFNSLRSFG